VRTILAAEVLVPRLARDERLTPVIVHSGNRDPQRCQSEEVILGRTPWEAHWALRRSFAHFLSLRSRPHPAISPISSVRARRAPNPRYGRVATNTSGAHGGMTRLGLALQCMLKTADTHVLIGWSRLHVANSVASPLDVSNVPARALRACSRRADRYRSARGGASVVKAAERTGPTWLL